MIDLYIPVKRASTIFKLNGDPINITRRKSNKRLPYL
ncbi:MAG: hypothetical protein ACJAWA_000763 [Nonlabens sp.]|jgi:hypothetical protein